MKDPQDEHIEPAFRGLMNAVATTLDMAFNGDAQGHDRKIGWTLFVFEFHATGRLNYISNANRDDMIASVEEWLVKAKAERGTN